MHYFVPLHENCKQNRKVYEENTGDIVSRCMPDDKRSGYGAG